METRHEHNEFMNDYLQYVYGGLLGFIVLIVPAMVPLNKLDLWLTFALACFAIAIPALALLLIMIFFRRFHPGGFPATWTSRWKLFHKPTLFLALGTGLFGIAGIFLHIRLAIGILFLVSAGVAGGILNYCANRNTH